MNATARLNLRRHFTPHRGRKRWLGGILLGLALVVWPVATASTAASAPAQMLYDQVNQILLEDYGGLSTVDRAALGREYQLRLDAVCNPTPQNCPVEKAYPVIQAEVTALGDEHSYFQTPEDFEDFVASATGGNRKQFGVKLAELDGQSRVVLEVIPDSVAEEAGLRRGDVLQTLNGQPYLYDKLHTARLEGQRIELGFDRQGKRMSVNLTPRESSTRDLPRLSYVGPNQDVALIRIPTFLAGGGVAQRVHELVAQAQARQARGIIVDLRGNGGGDLIECDNAVSAFVPAFTRVARTADGDIRTLVSRGTTLEDGLPRGRVRNPRLWTGPLTVLVDQDSASCSEFFAYEVQYAGRGPILGENTAGVGNTATRVFELDDKTALQLTITNYAKPDGTPYPVRVAPNQVHVQSEDDLRRLTRGEDTLLNFGLQAIATAPTIASDRYHN